MPRYRITIEYDGAPFVGWQMQDNGPSVQAALTDAIEKLSGEQVQVFGAGRTDAGVHALAQVAHFDLSKDWVPGKIRDGLNYHLRPQPVAVLVADTVDDDFHARFSAIKRAYLYRIVNRRADLALERGKAWLVHTPLDADAMHEAAQVLIGNHDFTTFRAAQCQANSPVRTLDGFTVHRAGESIEFYVSARSFLHNQVRSMVGSLKLVGEGRWAGRDLHRALTACDRSACGPVAPADGLYLAAVGYGSAEELLGGVEQQHGQDEIDSDQSGGN
jgi:tRNA pseudouridine38-40 synthase